MSQAFIRHQLQVVTGLFGYQYGPSEEFHNWVLEQLSAVLSALGLSDIRDLALVDREFVTRERTFRYKEWVNARTGEVLSGKVARVAGVGYLVSQGLLVIDNPRGLQVAPDRDRYTVTRCATVTDYEAGGSYEQCTDSPVIVRVGGATDQQQLFGTIGRYGSDGRDTDVSVYAKFTDDGVPYFLVAREPHRSSKDTFKEFLSLAVVAASMVIPGLGATLASSVFGSYAAAYPAVANAVVNTALQTALNGGDVEAAAARVAAGMLGQQVGGLIQGVSDSQAIGRLTSVAVSAGVQGESMTDAVRGAALSLAPIAFEEISDAARNFITSPAEEASMDYDFDTFDFSTGEQQTAVPAVQPDAFDFDTFDFSTGEQMAVPAVQPGAFDFDTFDFSTGTQPDSSAGLDLSTAVVGDAMSQVADIEAQPASTFFGDLDWESVVDGVTDVAIAAIRVHQAYEQANRPPVQPVQQTTRTGTTQTARNDGTLTTTDPVTGRPVITRPPAGVPYQLPDGGAVINNGNGSYTVINGATGQSTVRQYPVTVPPVGSVAVAREWIPGVSNTTVMLAGAGLIGLVLLARR